MRISVAHTWLITIEKNSTKQVPFTVRLKSSVYGSYRFRWQNKKWAPQKTNQLKQLFAKPYSLDGEKWQLAYSVNPNASKTDTFADGRKHTYKGVSLSLRKTLLPIDGKTKAQKAVILRQLFFTPNPSAPAQWWSGDAVIDEKTHKAYLVLSDGSRFSVQVVNLAKPKKTQSQAFPALPGVPIPDIEVPAEQKDARIDISENVEKALPFIDTISLKKIGDDLIVALNGSTKPQDEWIYSLKKEAWHSGKP